MFRKTSLALAAVATLTTAAAIPTTASAYWNGGWHRPYYSPVARYHAPYYAYRPHCYTRTRWVHTHWGWRPHRVRVCR